MAPGRASETIKILLVEDDALDAELIERALRRGGIRFEVRRVDDRAGYLSALDDGLDLVLSDYQLPQFDGLSALALLKERCPEVPFILVSGTISEELAVAAMRSGAADYLLKDRLSRLAPAVSGALEQAQLRREKSELEERLLRANRMESLGRLASGMAHDLNNILQPILIAQGLLRTKVQEPAVTTLLDTIDSNAQRGASVLQQLLSLGRGVSRERVPVRLSVVVGEMEAIMRQTFPRDIAVVVEELASDVLVLADQTQLHQVLMNLCVNARDAMPLGGQLNLVVSRANVDCTTAKAYPGAKPGPHAVLSVVDTGSGIAEENLGRIFDPFFSTKPPDQGTGLGLSSVLGIVRSHAGFIRVDSGLGRGAAFHVHLPLVSNEPKGAS
jgi:signal transduction histidine kinase